MIFELGFDAIEPPIVFAKPLMHHTKPLSHLGPELLKAIRRAHEGTIFGPRDSKVLDDS